MNDKEERKVPGGRLSRMAKLAATGAKMGAGLLLDRDGKRGAAQAAEVLGTLRGLAAKVGQMASYIDGLVPDEQRAAYEAGLKKLLAQAPRSSSKEIVALLEKELGGSVTDLFAEWDAEPLASASIGQVHRARLHDGREVAVKVQHPGIERAVESDLASAGVLESLGSLGGARRFQSKEILEVLRARFREELDYALEAQRIVAFQVIHEGDPTVRIPVVLPERSTRRVLTTELVRGLTFDEACTRGEGERRAWAETMWRYVFKGNLIGALFNADPHPGNYILHDGGGVTFLDYGCVQPIAKIRLDGARKIHRAAIARDDATFRTAVCEWIESKPGRFEDLALAYTKRCFAPLMESPYRITRPYAASLVTDFRASARVGLTLDKSEFFPVPPDTVFFNRLQFGFYSVLARLDVEVDYAAVESAFLNASAA